MLTPESVIPWLEGKPTVASILEQHQTDSARVAELDWMLTREIDAAIKKEDLIHRYRAALSEMSDELSHYPEGNGIFGHLKRILRRALA